MNVDLAAGAQTTPAGAGTGESNDPRLRTVGAIGWDREGGWVAPRTNVSGP